MKIILVGCGGISSAWLSAVKTDKRIKVGGLVDLSKQRAEDKAVKHGLKDASVFTNLKDAVKEIKPDVAFNCTVPEAHFQTTSICLESGCHVFSEKPMASTKEEAEQLCRISEKTGKVLSVMQNRRYQPDIIHVKELLRSKNIGKLTTLNSDFYMGAFFEGFRKKMKNVLLLDMAIHTFDAARFLSGEDPLSVYCKEWNPDGSWFSHGASATAVFEMTGGLVYAYRGSWTSPGMNTSWESEWRIIGESGTLLWDGGKSKTIETLRRIPPGANDRIKKEIPGEIRDGNMPGRHKGAILDFLACLRKGELPQTHCRDNIKSLSMVFCAIQSAKEEKKITIGEQT